MKPDAVFLALGACLLLAIPGRADVTVETKVNGKQQLLYAAEHQLEVGTPDGGMIFRGDKKVLWSVDSKNKTYSEMTEEDAKAVGAKANDAMAQMKEAMKSMPPEQRAMVEKMMSKKMPASQEITRQVKATGESKTINGFPCKGYTVSKSNGSSTEVWAADLSAVHLDPKDLQVFKEFSDFMKNMIPGMNQFAEWVKDYEHPRENEIPGFPVLSIEHDASGKETLRSELVRVDSGKIPTEKFEVPAGFKMEKKGF
jgi:hypothetical protein